MKYNAMAIDVRARIIYSALAIMTIMFSMGRDLMAQTKNIVLVHGGFVDGFSWEGVYKILTEKGLWPAKKNHALMTEPSASEPRPELFHLTYTNITSPLMP